MRAKYPDYTRNGSQVCIEGFPRSGNTFFCTAFRRWNPRINLAHHTHLASSIIRSTRRGLPTVLLIRNPEDAVASVIAWDGLLNVNIALLSYIIFHRLLWRHRDGFVVIKFEDAIQKTGDSVLEVNHKFRTDFNIRIMDDEEKSCIERQMRSSDLAKHRNMSNASLPNSEKESAKKAIQESIRTAKMFPYAIATYRRFSALSNSNYGIAHLQKSARM